MTDPVEADRSYLRFGIEDLDAYLQGGMSARSLVEVCGPKRLSSVVGRHLCMQALASKKYGGLDTGVIYLNTHPITSLKDLKWRLNNTTIPDAWDRICKVQIADEDSLFYTLEVVQRLLMGDEYSVLIIDSLSDCLFESREYYREHYRERHFDKFEHKKLMCREAASIIEFLNGIKQRTDAIVLYTFEIEVYSSYHHTQSAVRKSLNGMNDLRFLLYREDDWKHGLARMVPPDEAEFLIYLIYDRVIESLSHKIYVEPSQEASRDISLRICEENCYPEEEYRY